MKGPFLGQGSVERAAERRKQLGLRRFALEPPLREDRHDPIPHLDPGDAVTDAHHFSGAVRERNERQRLLGIVETPDHEQIAEVQRDGVQADEHVAGGEDGRGALAEGQVVEAERVPDLEGFHEPLVCHRNRQARTSGGEPGRLGPTT